MPINIFPILVFGLIVFALILFLYLIPVPLWIAAWSSGAYVGLTNLIGMRFRRVPPHVVVNARISAVKAGLDILINDLEALYLAGGHVGSVVKALISGDKANIEMSFSIASGIDLAGRDVLEAVKMSVIPTDRQPHLPPARPTHSPSSKTETRRPSSSQDFPSTWREVGQILRDLKTEAKAKQGSIKTPDKIPIPHQGATIIHHKEIRKEERKDRSHIQKKINSKRITEEKVTLVKAKTIREDKIERAEISFNQPGLFIQGIILSEVLRPPMARRNHLLLPYMRG